jgi:type IV pilus assembly protein PilA
MVVFCGYCGGYYSYRSNCAAILSLWRPSLFRYFLTMLNNKFSLFGLGIVFAVFLWTASFYFSHDYSFFTKSSRANDSYAKIDLHNLYLSCRVFWIEKGLDKNCNVSIASSTTYGFVQSRGVKINGSGTEKTFIAKAQHQSSNNEYEMDAAGNIK